MAKTKVTTNLDGWMVLELEQMAKRLGLSMAAVVRMLVLVAMLQVADVENEDE